MLDDESRKSIDLIETIASQIWGDNHEFGEIKIIDSPYSEFELPMQLYHKAMLH